ncbi:MAG TPA: A24 family peptidase [Nocardioidaceae bacterium]|nr:A24 family peptidase [Nocardioidaceae bacterium]
MSADAWFPVPGLTMAVLGALLGWFVPALVSRIPEPEPEMDSTGPDEAGAVGDGSREPAAETAADQTAAEQTAAEQVAAEEPKERYDAIAALPGLAWKTALASALTSALVGARLGWDPALLVWAYLVPVGVALALVDWRTRLLPTKVIAPSYAVVVALTLLAGAISGDWDSVIRAGLGWLIAGGTFFVLWFVYPRGLGYGDVRLSGLLGIALGYLGWGELLTGVYAGFLLGGVGGLLLSVLRIVDRKAYPFGPFMLVGAVVGVLAGPGVAAWYA